LTPQLLFELRGERMEFAIEADCVRIGRSADNDLVIQDGSISRHHAEIYRDGEAFRVRDLGSKNGTHVNQVTGEDLELNDGDELILGKFPMAFQSHEEPGQVELTAPEEDIPEEGTIFRSAVDFSALAAGAVDEQQAVKPELDPVRLKKLLQLVTQASEVLLKSANLDETLERVLDLVFEHLPVERGFVALWDEESESLAPRAVKKRDGDDGEVSEIKFSRTIAEKVYHDKVSVLTTDAQSDPRFAHGQSIMALGIRSAMAAPLWNGDIVEGIIYCDTPLHVKAFDDFDLDLLSALGNHVAVALERARLQENIVSERVSRERLARYHSPAVVERITQSAGDAGMEADERNVTVLFADVVGFTSRCETMEPRDVANMLNNCFSGMAEAIFKHEGTLDKFIGDCLMAVFGAPLVQEDHPVRAVEAALDMRQALAELNQGVPPEEQIRFRVGMHSGKVIAGDIGSVRRSDYTVLGATVNLASRMESSVAKPGQIIVTDTTYEATKDRYEFRLVGEFQPKGISRVVRAYEVLRRCEGDTGQTRSDALRPPPA
jgi:adenylate cyclase